MPKQIPNKVNIVGIGERAATIDLLVALNQLIDWAHGVEERLPEIITELDILEGSNATVSPGGGGQDYKDGAGGKQGVVYTEMPKETKPSRWRAVCEGNYWYVNDWGDVTIYTDHKLTPDNYRYNTGNYFQTKAEALAYREALLARFNAPKTNMAPEYKSDIEKFTETHGRAPTTDELRWML